jgi:hypothetical protein
LKHRKEYVSQMNKRCIGLSGFRDLNSDLLQKVLYQLNEIGRQKKMLIDAAAIILAKLKSVVRLSARRNNFLIKGKEFVIECQNRSLCEP